MSTQTISPSENQTAELAVLIDELTARLQAGEPVDMAQVMLEHADYADELAELLPAIMQLVNLSGSNSASQPSPCAVGESFPELADFRILREIGRGGMGIVYEAVQVSLGRRVALKVLPRAATMDPRQLERFKNEAKAVASLRHEHIVHVYGVGCEQGVHYYSMEFVDGQTLAQHIRSVQVGGERPAAGGDATLDHIPGKKTPTHPSTTISTERSGSRQRDFYRTSATLIKQAAEALEHAHSLGIVHRDVKPGNLLLDSAGGLWVSDFGLARLGTEGGLTVTGDLLGTLRYMSPEQALGKHNSVDHRTDVYSLGVTLYELLTLRPAFTGADRQELLRQVTSEEPLPPRRLSGTIPAELETIVLKAMSKEPGSRYPTAGALAADLERWLSGEPIHARPVSQSERVWRHCRRNPVVSSLMAAVVLVAAGGFIGVISQWQVAVAAGQEAITNAAAAQVSAQEAKDQAQVVAAQLNEVKTLNEKLEATQAEQRSTLYAAHINLAQHAWEASNPVRVAELLEQHRPKPGQGDLRGFEWHYLNRLAHSEALTLKGHTRSASSVAYSPDGKRIATAARGVFDPVKRMRIGGETKIWDAQTGKELLTIEGDAQSVRFSPDGKRLAVSGSEVKILDAASGNELFKLDGNGPVEFSPDGKKLATGGFLIQGDKWQPLVKLWDAQTGQRLNTPEGYSMEVEDLAFSQDGKILAVTSSLENAVRLWDTETGKVLHSLESGAWNLAFSPNGKLLATAGREVKLWDPMTGQAVRSFESAIDVAFSPDSKRLVTSRNGKMQLWEVDTGKEIRTLKGRFGKLAFSPEGNRVASLAGDTTVRVWDVIKDQESRTLDSLGDRGFAVSADWSRYVRPTPGNQVSVRDVESGQEIISLKGHGVPARVVAISSDGKQVATGAGGPDPNSVSLDDQAEVKLWDATAGQELFTLQGSKGTVFGLAFSPDGNRLACVSQNPSNPTSVALQIWDTKSGRELVSIRGHESPLSNVLFSPDGNSVVSYGGGAVKMWDASSGQEIRTISISVAGWRQGLAFSPDGKSLACGGNRKVAVVNIQTGQELIALKGHTLDITAMAISPDGKRLVSRSRDATVKIWDLQTGQELLTLDAQDDRSATAMVSISPDSHRLAFAGPGGTIKIYDATPLPEKP